MPYIPTSDEVEVSQEEKAQVFVFLTQLRASDHAPNMMDSWRNVMQEFGLTKGDSQRLAIDWMEWFEEQPEDVIHEIEEADESVLIKLD